MANLTADGLASTVGKEGRRFDIPVAASTTLYKAAMISQTLSGSSAGGACVPAAGTSDVVGVSTHGVANSGAFDAKRLTLESDRIFEFNNATAGEACSEAMPLFSVVYAKDDNTISKTNTGAVAYVKAGLFCGMSEEGLVRVYIGSPSGALSALMSTLVGVLPAQASNDFILPLGGVVHGATYDVGTTAAASTVTLPAATTIPNGTRLFFVADGTKNGHTVQYRDATGPVNLTTALTASKRHLVVATAYGAIWHANAYISP